MKENQNKQAPRRLAADEIDVRVAQTSEYDGKVVVNLLLYKDARVDMKILDELYGPMNWQRSHQLIGDRLYCTIKVWDEEKQQWIAKQDVGTESNTEPEKGQASDAFKRAGFNWSIGRELYTAPTIKVTLEDNGYEFRRQGNSIKVFAAFHVERIGYDECGNINDLAVADRVGKIRFSTNKAEISTQSSGDKKTPGSAVRRENSRVSAAPAATDGANASGPMTREQFRARRVVTLADVQRGKASRLISELSKHDYDDARDWSVGKDALLAQYDYEPGVLEEIEKLAVAERDARQQQAVRNVTIPA